MKAGMMESERWRRRRGIIELFEAIIANCVEANGLCLEPAADFVGRSDGHPGRPHEQCFYQTVLPLCLRDLRLILNSDITIRGVLLGIFFSLFMLDTP